MTPLSPPTKFVAQEPTRVFVLACGEGERIFVINLEKDELFKLRRGQTFYGKKPPTLKEMYP